MRETVSSGAPWEASVGYSRGVRLGNMIAIAGTTATQPDGSVVGVGDAYTQAKLCFEKIGAALTALGAGWDDVIRTRMYVIHADDQASVGRAHAEVFATIRPAATMVGVAWLAHPDHLVEIEVDAVVRPI